MLQLPFCLDQIEFDIASREVTDEAKFEAVVCFMQSLARELNKAVVLTPENIPESVLFSATPAGVVECCVENYPI